MKKKLLLLVSTLSLCSISFAATVKTTIGDLTYSITIGSSGSATVTGRADGTLTEICIPDIVVYEDEEYPVRTIGSSAFKNTDLTSVTIGSNVTGIEGSAFSGCKELTNITIPENITYISTNAFANSGLKTVIIKDSSSYLSLPNAVSTAYYSNLVFDGCPIEDIYVGRNFSYTYSVQPNPNASTCYTSPFYNLKNLRTIVFGSNFKTIPSRLLYGNSSIETLIFESTQLNVNTASIVIGNKALTQVVFNASNLAKAPNFAISNPTLPENLHIAVRADLVEEYKSDSFWGQFEIEDMVVRGFKYNDCWYGLDMDTKLGTLSFDKQHSLDNYNTVQNIIIDEYISLIGFECKVMGVQDQAFNYSWALTNIDLPETIEYIGENAFAYCTSLRSIEIPAAVKTIGNDAFTGCSALAQLNLNEGLEEIGDYAFFGCTGLDKITVPSSVVSIGERAFMGLHWLNDVYAEAMIPADAPISTFSENAYRNAILHIPAGTLNLYKSHPTWSKFLNIHEEGGEVTEVDEVELIDEAEAQIYTLSGIKITDLSNIPSGIYIRVSGNRKEKIVFY